MNRPFLFSAVVLLGLATSSCDRPEVPPVSDDDEIARLMAIDERANDLFRTDSLIMGGEYRFRFDSGVFVDLLDSVTRRITINQTGTVEIQGLGKVREAIVTVEDLFWVRIQRTHNSVTTIAGSDSRPLTRFGYLLKLGADNRPFLGWDLYGFSSLAANAPVDVRISSLDNKVVFHGDWGEYGGNALGTIELRYIKLSDIDTVKNGTALALSTSQVSPTRYYHILSANTSQGHKTEGMTRVSGTSYVDSLTTATANNRLYDLLMIQTFKEETPVGQHVRTWCIPYRVAQ